MSADQEKLLGSRYTWTSHIGPLTNSIATAVKATPGAGKRLVVTDVLVTNIHASVDTLVTLQSTADTPIEAWSGVAGHAGGGFSCNFRKPVPLAENVGLNAVCGASATVHVSVGGYVETILD